MSNQCTECGGAYRVEGAHVCPSDSTLSDSAPSEHPYTRGQRFARSLYAMRVRSLRLASTLSALGAIVVILAGVVSENSDVIVLGAMLLVLSIVALTNLRPGSNLTKRD